MPRPGFENTEKDRKLMSPVQEMLNLSVFGNPDGKVEVSGGLKATGSSRGSWNIPMLVIFTDLQQLCGPSITGEGNSTCAEIREKVEPLPGTEAPSSSYGPQPRRPPRGGFLRDPSWLDRSLSHALRRRTSWPRSLGTHHSRFGAAANPPVCASPGNYASVTIRGIAPSGELTLTQSPRPRTTWRTRRFLPRNCSRVTRFSSGVAAPAPCKRGGRDPTPSSSLPQLRLNSWATSHGDTSTSLKGPRRQQTGLPDGGRHQAPLDSSHQLSCRHPAELTGPGPPHRRERGNMPLPEQGVLLFCQPVRHSHLQSQGAQRSDPSKPYSRLPTSDGLYDRAPLPAGSSQRKVNAP
eukprot:XP_022273705.1 uncharacterized protein LOC111095751 [Canis lupus familiaris]